MRFLSADPIVDNNDPRQLNGYAYSNNSPVTFSDPTGLLSGGQCGPDGILCGGRRENLSSLGRPRSTRNTRPRHSSCRAGRPGRT
ncbi:RHS repeat-associated core domain-containing protein [Lentzea nigeriaca]|uniref:RHS repeat-associated core domain-containing protein n=1 Tax=Lentzea nigeriaca TaxID=1128665 RepID=UPI0019577A5C